MTKQLSVEERCKNLANLPGGWTLDDILIEIKAAEQAAREETKTQNEIIARAHNEIVRNWEVEVERIRAEGFRAGQEKMREIMNKAIQELGAPVMDYAPEYAVKEYDAKITRAVTILSALPIEEERRACPPPTPSADRLFVKSRSIIGMTILGCVVGTIKRRMTMRVIKFMKRFAWMAVVIITWKGWSYYGSTFGFANVQEFDQYTDNRKCDGEYGSWINHSKTTLTIEEARAFISRAPKDLTKDFEIQIVNEDVRAK